MRRRAGVAETRRSRRCRLHRSDHEDLVPDVRHAHPQLIGRRLRLTEEFPGHRAAESWFVAQNFSGVMGGVGSSMQTRSRLGRVEIRKLRVPRDVHRDLLVEPLLDPLRLHLLHQRLRRPQRRLLQEPHHVRLALLVRHRRAHHDPFQDVPAPLVHPHVRRQVHREPVVRVRDLVRVVAAVHRPVAAAAPVRSASGCRTRSPRTSTPGYVLTFAHSSASAV